MTQPSMPGQPNTVVLTIDSLRPDDVVALVERVAGSASAEAATTLACDIEGLSETDLRTVNALARLALGVRRLGLAIQLHGPTSELRELLDLAGLCDVMPCAPGSVVEVVRKPEQREEPLGVEEEGDPGDSTLA